MEIRLDPRVRVADDAFQGVARHLAVDDHPDTIAGSEDRVEVVRDHDHGEIELLAQVHQQLVEGGGADRVEARRGFVEQQQARVERQGARQCSALDHAARQLRRILAAGLVRQSDQSDLEPRQLVERVR